MAGRLLACAGVSSRVTGIVGRDCYPYRPVPLVYFGMAKVRRKKAAMTGGLCLTCGVWPSVVIVAFHDAIHALTFHAQK